MKPPPFLKVLPADVGQVGALGACVLALVRYVTSLPGEINGRRMVDGEMWWRASAPDIAEALGDGLSPRTVSGTVRTLTNIGALTAIPTQDFYGDRAKAYRAPDLPSAKCDTGSDLPSADIADRSADIAEHVGKIRHTTSADIADLPSIGELEELSEGENARATDAEPLDVELVPRQSDAPAPLDFHRIDDLDAIVGEVVEDEADPEPQPYCDRHMPNGTDNSCGACGRRRRIREKWEQRQHACLLLRAVSKTADPAPPARQELLLKPEPPPWIDGPHGPRCPAHGHRKIPPADCTRCRDAVTTAADEAQP